MGNSDFSKGNSRQLEKLIAINPRTSYIQTVKYILQKHPQKCLIRFAPKLVNNFFLSLTCYGKSRNTATVINVIKLTLEN